MSWIDKIETDLIITTGDGKEFRPNWINAVKKFEFNMAQFDFRKVRGSRIDRGEPMAREFMLELFFQGEDHLDQSQAFELSSEDPRPWTLSHPYYGQLIVHPKSIEFDNRKHNITRIKCPVIETITDTFPNTTVAPADKILADAETTNTALANTIVDANPEPSTTDINAMAENNQEIYNLGSSSAPNTADSESYLNSFNDASSAILGATAEPLAAIVAAQAVITAPAQFTDTVRNRLDTLTEQFNRLVSNVAGVTEFFEKLLFENNASTLISAMTIAAATPLEDDYEVRTEVTYVAEQIYENFDNLLSTLDGLQASNKGNPNSFIPGQAGILALTQLVNFTLANLFNIAQDAKQERYIYLEADSNPVSLTHRFYGLDPDDENLEKFIKQNDVGQNEILLIRKGRRVVYYL